MRKFALTILAFFSLWISATAQESTNDWSNLGLKMGIGAYSFYGDELKNPRPMFGYVAGLYYHSPLEKGRFHLQTGLDIRFRGGNFANAREGDTAIGTAYTKISLVSLDLPVQLLISTNLEKQREALFVTLGAQASYLMRSVLYVGPDQIPLNQSVYMQTWDNLPLKPIELLLSVGVQQRFVTVGYAISLNMGITNLNDNFLIQGISPASGNGLGIGTWSLEASLLF
jgi:hypothetical protein